MTTMLIADIGGTYARFAIADAGGVHDARKLRVADFPSPLEAARHYLGAKSAPAHTIFAVAGPIVGDHFILTNFPWAFSIRDVSAALGTSLSLINDFHAMALGVLDAAPETVTQIGGGTRMENGNIGVIGPGTGLGVGSLVYDPLTGKYTAIPSEGGHVTIPCVTPREFAIITWLLDHKYTHVSAERVCSGKGLLNLYDALRAIDEKALPDRTPEEITASAMDGSCVLCRECLDLMMAFLGRIAGNLALTVNALGGVYFAGGILPHLGAAYVGESRLRAQFIAKGRQSAFVDRMPCFLVDDPILALRGLRRYGLDALG